MATRMHISRATHVAAPAELPEQAKEVRVSARVLVLDGHCSAALAFVPSLGRAGHWVAVAAAENLLAPATLSRYCQMRLEYPNPTRGAARFREAVLPFVQQHGIRLVLPMTDAVEALVRQRDVFRGKAELVLPSPAALGIVLDKYQTICLARELGIPIPETRSLRWAGDQAVAGSVAYAYSREELQTKVAQRLQAVKDVLIQEFVPGRGVGFSCFVADGEVYLPFQWERIREKDPRGSGSSARRSVPLCKWLAADLVHLENLWQGKPAGWPAPYPNFWTSLLKIAIPWYPGLRYDDISFSDPKPGLRELVRWFRRHLGGNAVGHR